jgi:hypothetical protein
MNGHRAFNRMRLLKNAIGLIHYFCSAVKFHFENDQSVRMFGALAPRSPRFLPVGERWRRGSSCRRQSCRLFLIPTHTFELQFQPADFLHFTIERRQMNQAGIT